MAQLPTHRTFGPIEEPFLNDPCVDERFQSDAHFISRPVEPTANGADRQSEYAGDLLVLQSIDLLENQRDAKPLRHSRQSMFDHSPPFLGFHVASRISEFRLFC